MSSNTTFIIEETFITDDTEDRKKKIEDILLNIIKSIELHRTM